MKKKEEKKAAALKYRHRIDAAPRVVASGKGLLAERIIDLAREQGVPLHEDIDLVEILSKLDLQEEIPPELYKAVAAILVFIHKMNQDYGE